VAKKPTQSAKPEKAQPTNKKPATPAPTATASKPAQPDLNVQKAKAWDALCRIKVARTNAKNRVAELIAQRRDLDSQLNALGAGSTSQHLSVSREYVICLRSIDAVRAAITTLADRMERVIDNAMQGRLSDDDVPPDTELFFKPTEADLFHSAADDDEVEGQMQLDPAAAPAKKRRGQQVEPKVPDQPGIDVPEDTDQHLNASIEELDLADHVKGKLYKAGYRVIAALVRIVDDPEQDLMTVLNCDDAQAKSIRGALGEFRSRHRRAMREVEKDAAGDGGLARGHR
jgi:hypothetical protein